jgi:hypothetical protein
MSEMFAWFFDSVRFVIPIPIPNPIYIAELFEAMYDYLTQG